MPNEDSVTQQIDSVRGALAISHIRGLGEQRRNHLRALDVQQTADRLMVAFAAFLPADAELPSDAFLREHAERIYNAILGVTRAPRKVE
jgi:hypothetical protein